MRMTKKNIKVYCYNIDLLKNEINLINEEISTSNVEKNYLENLVVRQTHLRALYLSIRIVLEALSDFERDVYNYRKEKITFEKISEILNKSCRYIITISTRLVENVYLNYTFYVNN